jgi:hypothetical protein
LGGSSTVGTRANNDYEFITLSKSLKFDQQKVCEKPGRDLAKPCYIG